MSRRTATADSRNTFEMPVPQPDTSHELAEVLQWAFLHLDQPLTVNALAARGPMPPRAFARRFRQRTGATPGSWVTHRHLASMDRPSRRTR